MSGLVINISIPSLERIGEMRNQEELRHLLESANQTLSDLRRYRVALIIRLLKLQEVPRGRT